MQKPPAKPAPAPAAKEETPVAAPPKSKKLLVISIILLLTIIAGGAIWALTKGTPPAAEHAAEATPEAAREVKFVPLGENFTVNLQREEGDQYLQAGITLKILQPELEEKIKAMMPEIRSKLLFLLSEKKPSELQTAEGKRKLISEIIVATDAVLGLGSDAATAAPANEGAVSGAASAPVAAAQEAVVAVPKTTGVVDVLFTSFIIQ
jgi:flagellar protein FliL